MREHIWPHPKLAEKFEELYKQSEAIESKIRTIETLTAALRNDYRRFSDNVADCVRVAIMQRDNAESAATAREAKQE